jgi:hypothetical protein
MRHALEDRVDEIGQKKHGEQAEEPSLLATEAFLRGRIFVVVREEHRAGEEQKDRIEDHERIKSERPLLDPEEAELEPPEVDDEQQQEQRPSGVQDARLSPAPAPNDPRQPSQQTGMARPVTMPMMIRT